MRMRIGGCGDRHSHKNGRSLWHSGRKDLYDRIGEQLGEQTKFGAIDGACEFTEQMIPNLERAMEHPDMTEELVEILSTNLVRLEYRIETDVQIGCE